MSRAPFAPIGSSAPPENPPGVEECFVDIGGGRMRYLRAGSGPALILVHGLMGYSFSWRFVIPELRRIATVYAVDLLGTGFSDHPPDLDCRLLPSAERLLQFVERVGVFDFDLLGTSHGGAVAIRAAALLANRSTPRLRRLILVAPVNPWSPHGRWLAPLLGSRLGSLIFQHVVTNRPATHAWVLRRLYGDPKKIAPGTLEGYMAPASQPGFMEYGLKIASHWTEGLRDLASALPLASDYPALLIWGSEDRAVYASSAEPLRRAFRQCEAVIFAGVGHLPYEEAPEDFNRVLIRFLTGPSSAEPEAPPVTKASGLSGSAIAPQHREC
jgi:pimeloyl-ACP methyl ester carboxylesterase